MKKCNTCEGELPIDGTYIICRFCLYGYHHKCVGITENTYQRMSQKKKKEWMCCECRKSVKSTDNKSVDSTKEILDFTGINELKVIILELKAEVRASSSRTENELGRLSLFYDDIKNEISELQKSNKDLLQEVKQLRESVTEKDKKIASLEEKIIQLEQYGRNKNIEIHGLKLHPDGNRKENLHDSLQKIADKLDIPFSLDGVEAVHRLPTRRKTDSPPIIVQFSSRKMRDFWISKKREKLTNDMVLADGSDKKVYINENLVTSIKDLLYKTKQKAGELQYKFVWVRNGKIFVKKSEDVFAIKINTEADLQKIK